MWLGWLDSNQRMTVSKTVALPLGDTPIGLKQGILYQTFRKIASTFLERANFLKTKPDLGVQRGIRVRLFAQGVDCFVCSPGHKNGSPGNTDGIS